MLSTLAPHLEFINTDIETYLQANVKRFRGRINVEQLKVFRTPACVTLRAYSHHVHHRLLLICECGLFRNPWYRAFGSVLALIVARLLLVVVTGACVASSTPPR